MNGTKAEQRHSDYAFKNFLRVFFLHSAVAIGAFFSSSATFNGFAPFGTAFSAGVKAEYIPAAVLGTAAGSFYSYGSDVLSLRYVASSAIAGIFAYILKRSFKQRFSSYFSVFSSFVSLLSTGLVVSASITLTFSEFLIFFAEGLAGAVSAFLFDRFFGIQVATRSILSLSTTEMASLLSVFCIFLLSLDSFSFLLFSPGVIFGVYSVLVFASYGGDKYGAIFGVTSGVMLGITENSTFMTGGVALGGLICGIFGKSNRFICAVLFMMSVIATAFSSEDWIETVNLLYNVIIGVTMFAFTPKALGDYYKKIFLYSADGAFVSGQKNVFMSRLFTAADGMQDVTERVKAVAGIYRRRSIPKEDDIYKSVCKNVCSDCERYNVCFEKGKDETMGWFKSISNSLKNRNIQTKNELPKSFLHECINQNRVIGELAYGLERYRAALRESAKTGETVNIVSDQFGSVAQLLFSFADTLGYADEFDTVRTNLVRNLVHGSLGFNVFSCGVFKNSDEKLFCELTIKCDKMPDFKKIVRAVEKSLGISFEQPAVNKLSDGTVNVVFCEKTRYKVETGGVQINSAGDKWCGDTYDRFFDGKGNFYVILSDGMGTGQKAAADSVMCCSLASLLLRSGYPVDSIIKMINSAMLVRSGEESLATLDIAVFNLYTGEAQFYKAGAAASIAMKKNKMFKIEKPSLPVGILGQVSFENVAMQFGSGDVFVLMSDGVSEQSVISWREILKNPSEYKGKQLAQKLCESTVSLSENGHSDDITVVTASIDTNN